jgi:hypothetical protein
VALQAPAPERLVQGGLPTEATVVQVLVARYADHLPLYRQAQMLARQELTLGPEVLARLAGHMSGVGFYDLVKGGAAPIATGEAAKRTNRQRIAALYTIEAEIRGRPARERLTVRQARSRPLMADLFTWHEAQNPGACCGAARRRRRSATLLHRPGEPARQ